MANGGLGNGVSRQQLVDVLQRCGFVESLIMPPNKPYSFVTYSSTEEAINAYTSLSGQELPSSAWEQKITLYLSFVDKGIAFLQLFLSLKWRLLDWTVFIERRCAELDENSCWDLLFHSVI